MDRNLRCTIVFVATIASCIGAFQFALAGDSAKPGQSTPPAVAATKSNQTTAKQAGKTTSSASTKVPSKSGTTPAEPLLPSSKTAKNGPIELEGEVVDAWCWTSGVMGPGRGPEHHKCAMKCILGGVSAGIVDDDNNLYIAAKSKAYTGCREQLAPYISNRVHIKGWIAERGGCRILKIGEVKDLGPAEKFNKKK